jgi:hypothetical protein
MTAHDTTAETIEGPQLINPFDLLNAHGIITSVITPRHDCRCGARFVIDPSAERPFEHSSGHIREIDIAASHAVRAFLAQVENKGIEMTESVRELMSEVAADSD